MALTDLTRISTSGIATGSSLSGAILHGDAHFRGTQVGVTSALFDSSDNALEFSTDVKLKFGDTLSIYKSPTHAIIDHTFQTGSYLRIGAANGIILGSPLSHNETLMRGYVNGASELYFAGAKKFSTDKHGSIVTGILTATGFSGPLSNASGISTFYDLRVTNNLTVEGTTTTLDTNLIGVDRVEVGADSNTVVGVAITQSGTADLVNLFDGATKVVTVDDQGNVGLGSAIPSGKLDVVGLTNLDDGNVSGVVTFTNSPTGIDMNDNTRISFGTSLKTSMFYNASESKTYIRNWNDTLHIGYRNTEIYHTNQARLTFDSGNTFSNVANTNFSGANYNVLWIPALNMFRVNDNAKLAFGNQADADIYHNGGNFYIDNDTGHLYIRNNVAADVDKNIYIQAKSGENSISCGNDGEVVLFSNSISANQVKLQTTGHGVHVTGIGTFTTSLRVTGSQNAQLTSNILSFDRAGYSYIDQTNNVGSLVFRVKANSTTALRIDYDSQSIFGASAHTIVGYGGTGTPHNNNSLSLYGTANVGLVGQYSSLNMPMNHSNANVGGNWWMLGRAHGTTNEWGLSSRPGNSNTLRRIWRVVNKSDNSGLLDYQSFHYNNGVEALRITSNGTIGIGGTTIPGALLDLSAAAPGIIFSETGVSANNGKWLNSANGSELYWQAQTDAHSGGGNLFKMTRSNQEISSFEAQQAGVTWFTVRNSDKKVGIGSAIPAERLVVQGNGISNLAYDHDGGGFTSNSGGALVLTGYYDYSGAKLGLMVDNAGQGRIMTKTNQSLLIGTNNSKVITINGSGQTGINTTPQGQLFSIRGATDIMHYPNSSIGNDRIQIGFNAPEGYIKAKNTTGSPAANIALYTTNTSGNTNKIMHLSHDGKVGINQNAPQATLHVRDSIPELRLTNTTTPNAFESGRIRFTEYETARMQGAFVHYDGDTNKFNIGVHNIDDNLASNDQNTITIDRGDGTLYKHLNNTTVQAAFGGTGQVNGITALPSMAGTPFVVGRDTGSNRSAHFGGNLNFNSGYGIDFSATGNGNGTMANELLDDYEEGSWTPDPHFATTGSAGETALADGGLQGQYVKIGRLVYYTFSINFQSRSGSASGNFYVSGLPYNVSNTYWNEESGFPSAYYSGLTNTTGAPSTQPSHADKLYFAIPSSSGTHGGNTYLNHNHIGTGHIRIRGGGIYRTAT